MWIVGIRSSRAMKRSMSRSNARCSASGVTRPSSSRAQKAWNVGSPSGVAQAGLEDAEEVVDPVLEGERVALDVEEQVARARLRQDQQAPVRLERSPSAEPGRRHELVERPPGILAVDLEARLLVDARQRLGAVAPSSGGSIGSARAARPRRVAIPRAPSAARWWPVMPATSERWSSSRRRAAHSPPQRQTSQCSTGSGYVAAGG